MTTLDPTPRPADRLLWLLPAIALAVGAVWAAVDSFSSIASAAMNDSESSHLWLVPLIAAWLVFVRRERLAGYRFRGLWVGTLIAGVGAAMYLIGGQNLRFWTWHAGAVVLLVGAIVTATGVEALRKFAPAFLVLAFLAPMPPRVSTALTVPMMTGGAVATEAILTAVGEPVTRNGNLLSINDVDVTVEEACAGMRGVWALTLVAVAFAFASPYRAWVRGVVLLLTPALALGCNVIRLVPTVWAYGHLSAESADTLHDLAGWVVLFVGYFLLTGFVFCLEAAGLPVMRSAARSTEEAS